MKAPERIYVEVCEDGIFAFPEPPFAESVEYIRADINKQPASEGLDAEIGRYWNWVTGFQPPFAVLELTKEDLAKVARHFAEWGAEHAKK